MRKSVAAIIIFTAVLLSACAVSSRSTGEISDARVTEFATAFYQAAGIGTEADFFTENCVQNEKTGTWSMQIQLLNGSTVYIDFGKKVINFTYITANRITKDRLAGVLDQINTSRFYTPYTFCLPVISPEGSLCFTYSLVDEGILDYGSWLYWHYRFFKSSAELIIEDLAMQTL